MTEPALDLPEKCECDDGNRRRNVPCRFCMALGRRNVPDNSFERVMSYGVRFDWPVGLAFDGSDDPRSLDRLKHDLAENFIDTISHLGPDILADCLEIYSIETAEYHL